MLSPRRSLETLPVSKQKTVTVKVSTPPKAATGSGGCTSNGGGGSGSSGVNNAEPDSSGQVNSVSEGQARWALIQGQHSPIKV